MENNPEPSAKTEKPDLGKTADQLSRHGKELKEKVTEVGQDVQEHASASLEYASAVTQEKITDGFDALSEYIKSNPLTTVVAAFSLGYVLGWFRNNKSTFKRSLFAMRDL